MFWREIQILINVRYAGCWTVGIAKTGNYVGMSEADLAKGTIHITCWQKKLGIFSPFLTVDAISLENLFYRVLYFGHRPPSNDIK